MAEIKARIVLEDKLSTEIAKPIEDVNKLKETLNSASNAIDAMSRKKFDVSTNEAVEKVKNLKSKLESLAGEKVSPVIIAIDKTKEVANKVKNSMSLLTKRPVNLLIEAVDKTKSVLSKVKESIMSLKTLAAGIVLGFVAKSTIGSASQLEQEQIAMKHFIGYNNQSKSDIDVQKMTDSYISQLRTEANATPFSTNEVIAAGRRAVNITSGDTSQGMDLVKLSENMAALNPGKSVMDAMEALADLKTGETERMKEFGFKITQNDINKAGGIGSYFKKQTSDKGDIGKVFAGGANELSKTTAGQWSTVTGNLESIGANFGKAFLPVINKILTPLANWLDKNSDKFTKFGENIVKLGNKVKTALTPAFNAISKTINPVINSMFNTVKEHLPGISKYFEDMWVKIKPSLQELWQAIKDHIIPIIMDIWGKVQKAMPGIKSLFEAACAGIGVAIKVFDWVAPKIQAMWNIISPVLNKVIDIFNFVASAIKGAVDWLNTWNGTSAKDKGLIGDKAPITGKNALGTSYWRGGFTWVGEHGPELVDLSSGSKVYNNRESKSMSGNDIIIAKLADQIVVREESDIDKIVTKLMKKLDELEPNMA